MKQSQSRSISPSLGPNIGTIYIYIYIYNWSPRRYPSRGTQRLRRLPVFCMVQITNGPLDFLPNHWNSSLGQLLYSTYIDPQSKNVGTPVQAQVYNMQIHGPPGLPYLSIRCLKAPGPFNREPKPELLRCSWD